MYISWAHVRYQVSPLFSSFANLLDFLRAPFDVTLMTLLHLLQICYDMGTLSRKHDSRSMFCI